jgi:hypothetical protein
VEAEQDDVGWLLIFSLSQQFYFYHYGRDLSQCHEDLFCIGYSLKNEHYRHITLFLSINNLCKKYCINMESGVTENAPMVKAGAWR